MMIEELEVVEEMVEESETNKPGLMKDKERLQSKVDMMIHQLAHYQLDDFSWESKPEPLFKWSDK
jgi:hypothetical protein